MQNMQQVYKVEIQETLIRLIGNNMKIKTDRFKLVVMHIFVVKVDSNRVAVS